MVETTSGSLDKWRDYFRTANSDIFKIIEHAIMVAASDCPFDFKSKRDRIAEVLFACKATKCVGCDRLELAVPPNGDGDNGLEKSEDKYKSGIETGGSKDSKESKVNSSNRDNDDDDEEDVDVDGDDDVDDEDDGGNHRGVMGMNANHGYADVEALNDEIEEESQFYGEVLRIKEILDNHEDESETLLFDSLRRLQLMTLTVETLKATEIGKSVNALRKHGSKEIRNLVKTLIEDWTIMVDSWVDATAAIAAAEIRPESVKTSAMEEEEGLPSPPLDEGAFFTTPTSMELSQFFDGMDDDGNPREITRTRENCRTKPNFEKTETRKLKNESLENSRPPPKPEQKRYPESVLKKQTPPKPNRPLGGERVGMGLPKPSNHESGPGRPKPTVKPNVQQRPDNAAVPKKPMPPRQEKPNCNNESSDRIRLEAAKRKLQERYQEAENAKKQRTIQVVELRDLPKQSVVQRNHQQMRPGNHNRNRPSGRR